MRVSPLSSALCLNRVFSRVVGQNGVAKEVLRGQAKLKCAVLDLTAFCLMEIYSLIHMMQSERAVWADHPPWYICMASVAGNPY